MAKYGGGMAEKAAQKLRGRGAAIDAAVSGTVGKKKPSGAKPKAKPAKKKPAKKKDKVYRSGSSFGGPTQATKLSKNSAKRHSYK